MYGSFACQAGKEPRLINTIWHLVCNLIRRKSLHAVPIRHRSPFPFSLLRPLTRSTTPALLLSPRAHPCPLHAIAFHGAFMILSKLNANSCRTTRLPPIRSPRVSPYYGSRPMPKTSLKLLMHPVLDSSASPLAAIPA
ncbi:hypothetical protein G6O67_005979 [Ophiocordyceps sinensis]|uniref:Uncharacterized protein n=1 Tax=Ophiocordyceps sinensis TaxID=72228 RepID=A0A8H4LXI9_9HYPO|nr:hypothetical protein G6O67_005979 [Ophiocordyceps sinensis]